MRLRIKDHLNLGENLRVKNQVLRVRGKEIEFPKIQNQALKVGNENQVKKLIGEIIFRLVRHLEKGQQLLLPNQETDRILEPDLKPKK